MAVRCRLVAGLLCLWWGAHSPAGAQATLEPLTDPEYTLEFAFQPPTAWPAGGEIRILLDQTDAGEGHALLLRPNRCCFARTQDGNTHPFGREGAWRPSDSTVRGVVQRRHSQLVALLDHQQVATAQDAAYHGGSVGWEATHDSLKLDDFHVQPVAPVEFADDFVREGDSLGGWEALAGSWASVGPEGSAARPDLSSNPFSFRGAPAPTESFALAAAGDWFWDDYRMSVAAKAESPGAMGVAAYVQDTANCLLFRWTSTGEEAEDGIAGRRQLIRIRDGEWTVLAETGGGFRIDRWYRLGLTTCDGGVAAEVDGRVVLRAADTSFGQGRIGLFAQSIQGASFDDISAHSARGSHDEFGGGEPGWWAAATGNWECRQDHLYGAIGTAKAAEATTGEGDWGHYTVATAVKVKTARSVGLTACRETEARFYAFRWELGGRQTLEAVLDGATTVLAEGHQPLEPTRFYELALQAGHGRLAAQVDGRTVLEAADARLTHGQAGLLLTGPGEACFDNAAVTFDEPRPPTFSVTAQFTREETMQNWVDVSRQWRKGEDGVAWFDMPLFGDFTLWLPEMDLTAVGGALDILIAPETGGAAAAPLRLATQAGSGVVSGRVTQGEGTLAEGQAEATGPQRLRVARRGSCLSAWLGDAPIVACRNDAYAGRGLGLRFEGVSLDLADASVASPNLVDVTFSGAPTDWEPQFGVWQVTDRWPCAPGWSWFGGSKHESPLLWSKDVLEGDQ
ncbi:MAG: hypothetical protein FJX74_21020, partial [Armatimonadetes bacterium]|nr:hypothetical protein [Armatimonadota bacterium]